MHKTGDDVKFGASEQHEGEKPALLSFASFMDLTSEAGFSFEHYVKHLRDAEKVVTTTLRPPTSMPTTLRRSRRALLRLTTCTAEAASQALAC